LTASEFEQLMLLHLCDDCDCTNAKFVYMRANECLKGEKNESLERAMAICN
jgi:hypothetical protein